jgi:hypothetical protein
MIPGLQTILRETCQGTSSTISVERWRAPIRAGDSPQPSALVRKPTCPHPLAGYRSHSRSLFDDCLVGAHGSVRGGRRESCGWEGVSREGERSMQQGVRPWRPSRVVGKDADPQLSRWSRTPARFPEEWLRRRTSEKRNRDTR